MDKKQITKKIQEMVNKKIEELVKIVPEPSEINPKRFYDLEGDIFLKGKEIMNAALKAIMEEYDSKDKVIEKEKKTFT